MEKISCDIIVITHRIWTDGKRKRGGLDKIVDHFIFDNQKVLTIEHPLEGLKERKNVENSQSVVTFWERGVPTEMMRKNIRSGNQIISWVKEVFFNVRFLKKKTERGAVLFSSDPLNNLTGICMGKFFSKRYFHCVDFSRNRFGNFILNLIYKIIFKLTFRAFDLVGVVSLITKEAIRQEGCSLKKLIYIPNSPEFKEIDISQKEPLSIIYTGGAIIKKYDYETVIDIISRLKKEFSQVRAYLVGGLQEDEKYVEKIKNKIRQLNLMENVNFTGFLNPPELEQYLMKSCVGLSFYGESVQYYTKFGDSLKMREYAMYGIPTISDGNSATDIEMQDAGAGFIIKDAEEAAEKIKALFESNELYAQIQKNCVEWARINDKKTRIKELKQELINEGR